MHKAFSKNGVPIRLTNERWLHITTGHPEMADYYYQIFEAIEEPDIIYQGEQEAKISVKEIQDATRKVIVAVYKELSEVDGFVITAYLTKKMQTFKSKEILWKPGK